MRYLIIFLLIFSSLAKAVEVITSDVGTWSGQYPYQICYAYGGANPCISDGTYFPNEGIGQGDVIFAYTDRYIYQTFSMPQGFSGDTMYLSLDMMTGPRNYNQGNKTEYVLITILQRNATGTLLKQDTIGENITNTTMQTFDYTITKHADTASIEIRISGRDGGYWAGNYGAVIGAGSITLNDGAGAGPVTSTTTGTSLGPTSTQSTSKSSAQTRRDNYSGDDNGIYVDQVGSNNTISILQDSTNNQFRGINQDRAKMWGDNNTYDIRQGAPTSVGINLIELMVDGNLNNVSIFQDRFDNGSPDSSASGDHILRLSVDGNSNDVDVMQRSEANKPGHFGEINITGDSNIIDLYQRAEKELTAFIDVTGSSNIINLNQTNTLGDGNHFASIKLTGDGHQVNLTQNGAGNHSATIDLTYGSAPSTLELNQLGNTNQSYSFEQTCYDAGGCSATLTQQ